MKVLIGAFAHESNDFCPGFTTREMFEFYEGQDVLDHLPVSDIFQKAGIEMVPSIFACAQSYGPVEKETYLYFEGKILDTLRQNPDIDGIWMFCHGAMNVEEIGSGEYRLACDMREITGDRCAISFGMDLHGNLEEDFCRQVNIFRCYHTAPHTDQADTYRRTAQTLVHYLQHGYRIFPQMRKLPMIFPGEMAATTVEPMQGIIAQLKQWIYLLSASNAENEIDAGSEEFLKISFMRGSFCSELMRYAKDMPISRADAYLMGMFSTLDYLIDAPMEDILEPVPLAEEIKALAGEVDDGVNDVEARAGELSQNISSAEQTLGAGTAIVGQTEGSFEKITAAAEGAVSVQNSISGVIQASQGELQVLCQFFDQIKGQYQEVVKHIDSASQLGTTKSAMFEDMDNMISQIPPLVKSLEAAP